MAVALKDRKLVCCTGSAAELLSTDTQLSEKKLLNKCVYTHFQMYVYQSTVWYINKKGH